MKASMKISGLVVATLALVASARANNTEPNVGVGKQYGYVAFNQSLDRKGVLASSIEISGLAANAIYLGMKDAPETDGVVPGVKVKSGENVTCFVNTLQQVTCVIKFETLATGKLGAVLK